MSNEMLGFEEFQLEDALQVLEGNGHTVGEPYFDEMTERTRCRVDGISLGEQTIFTKAFDVETAEKIMLERSE